MSGSRALLISALLLLLSCCVQAQQQPTAARNKLKVQLLLPLLLDEETELKGVDLQWQHIAVSYYQGVLMALDSLERTGISIELLVDDYQRDTNRVKEILDQPSHRDVDLIIGPLYKNGFAVAEQYAAKNKIPLLSPFLTFQSSTANEYSVIANPSIESYGRQLATYFNTHTDSCNVLLIHDNSKTDKSFSKSFLAQFDTHRHNLLAQYTYAKGKHPASALRYSMKNLVVIPAQDQRTVSTLLYQLHDTIADMPMSVFGIQPWTDFSNINYKVWDTLDIHILSPYFIDYRLDAVKNFVRHFRERNKTEPDEYAFRGYDQMLVMAYILSNYGKDFAGSVSETEYPALHTHFRFARPQKNGSIENQYLSILRFSDFRFQKVR